MKTKLITLGVALMLLLTATAKATEGDPYKTSLVGLREKIVNTVSALVVSLGNQEDAESYLVRFQVTGNNELSLVSTEGADAYVSAQIRKKLDGLKLDGTFDHSNVYTVKITFQKNAD
jgi:hypothetical protein